MSEAVTAWLKSGEYLPEFLRDFHDQKDVFKALDEIVARRKNDPYTRDLNWVTAQVYTIDVFLWAMARHGYTLQRSQEDLPFPDLEQWVSDEKDRRREEMTALLKENSNAQHA